MSRSATTAGWIVCAFLILSCSENPPAEAGYDIDIFGSVEWSPQDRLDQLEQTYQEQLDLADCMGREGFEYVPIRPGDGGAAYDGSLAPAIAFGFGVSTRRFPSDGLPVGLLGYEVPAGIDVDPNLVIEESLAGDEYEKYLVALYETCPKESADTARDRAWEVLGEEISDAFDTIDNDPRLVIAEADAVSCLKESGYEYEAEDYLSLIEAFAQSLEADLGEIESRGISEDGNTFEIDQADIGALSRIQQHEIAVAEEYEVCYEDVEVLRGAIVAEVEAAFREEHGAELQRLESNR